MNYRREIDGLRAVALLPVIFFHAGMPWFSGGYAGVDVFFVISGYLITSILVTDIASGTFTLADFYERRARRLLPALFFVILVCIPFAWEWMPPSRLREFSQSAAAVSLFSSNILFWQQSGYFAPSAELKPLLHTWSLAVEEQFYIVFPVFILWAWRFGSRALFVAVFLAGTASLLLAQWGWSDDPEARFYLLPARLWELLIGALTALYLIGNDATGCAQSENPTVARQFLGGLGLAMIVYSIFAFDDATPFPGFHALVPTVGAGLVVVFATRRTVVAWLLGRRILVGTGLISYSAYLWHQPIFAFARLRSVGEPGHALLLFLGLLSLVLAFFTWKYVERPFRDKSRGSRRQVFGLGVAASMLIVGAGLWGHSNDGFPSRPVGASQTYAENGLDHRIRVNHGLGKKCTGKFTLADICRTSERPEILVWGDSFAMHLVSGILASNKDAGIVQITKSACGPVLGLAPVNRKFSEEWAGTCLAFNGAIAEWIQGNDSLRHVVLSSLFLQYLSDSWKVTTGDGVLAAHEAIVFERFSSTLDFLVSQGVQPVVFAPPPFVGNLFDPMPADDIGACLVKASLFGDSLGKCDFSRSRYQQEKGRLVAFLKRIEKKHRVIWMDDFLCDNEACRAAMDGTFIFRDIGHLSHEGSALVGARMDFYRLITSPVRVE